MADIAVVFHWTMAAMDGMPLTELMNWRALAAERYRPPEH